MNPLSGLAPGVNSEFILTNKQYRQHVCPHCTSVIMSKILEIFVQNESQVHLNRLFPACLQSAFPTFLNPPFLLQLLSPPQFLT